MAAKVTVRDIDHGYRSLLSRLKKSRHYLTVGLHEAEGGDLHEDSKTDIMTIGEAHEFGLGVPRRSFIADWADENEDKHKSQLVKMSKAIVRGSVADWHQGLSRLGARFVGEVQKRISDNVLGESPYQPLKAETIRRKGSSVALIDTGQLRTSIRFYVDGEYGGDKGGGKETETVKIHLVRTPGGEWTPSIPSESE